MSLSCEERGRRFSHVFHRNLLDKSPSAVSDPLLDLRNVLMPHAYVSIAMWKMR